MKLFVSNFLLLFFYFPIFAQNLNAPRAFDSIYYHVAVNVASTNPVKALHIADSLYLYSETQLHKLRSIMLKADLLEKQGRREEAIKNALEAMKIAEAIANYEWQAKIYGFLSTQYRNIGFLEQGRIYLKKGIEISSKIENKQLASQFRGMTYQEMAYYALEERDYKEAIEHVELAALSFEMVQNEQLKNFFVGNNEEMFGRSYYGLKEYEEAKIHYYKSLKTLKKIGAENSQWSAMGFQGLGSIFLQQNQLDSAGIYLNKAISITEQTDHAALKENVYKDLATFYKAKKQMDSFIFYDTKYNSIVQENILKTKRSANSEFNRLHNNVPSESINWIYVLIGSVILVFVATILFMKRKLWFKQKDDSEDMAENKPAPPFMPQRTETELLEKLKEFELSQDYLDQKMSFSVLAGHLGTNAKYLSHLIKNHKNKDYNTYINELRIQYIVEKLKSDPEYLNYKISYLAEESGFSSHSKFSANFKRFVNLSPSEFIESLRIG